MNIPQLILAALLFAAAALAPLHAAPSLPDPALFSLTVERGDIKRVREWLDAGLAPDFEGTPIGTGLMIAAWTGNVPMLELFAARGADLNRSNALGEQAVQHAAWRGQGKALRWLVERGAQVRREGKQWAALHYAAFNGHADVVNYLLDSGADVNAPSTNGSTPLMMAAREGREAIAARLLQAGADPTLRNEWDDDSLRFAERNGNLRIASLIRASDPALRQRPVEVPPVVPQRSQPVPDSVDRMLAKAARLDAEGKRIEALGAYKAALALIKKSAQTPQPQVADAQIRGVSIRARREKPEQQSAQLRYETPVRSADKPISITSTTTPQGDVDDLMAQARALEAQGKRTEAMRLFRQAAALLRETR